VRRIVEAHIEQLQFGARRMGLPGLEIVTASSLPGGRVNAKCANDPGDGTHHIFADGELLVFCNSLGKLLGTAFTTMPAPKVLVGLPPMRRPLRAALDPELASRVVDLYSAVLFSGRARLSEPWIARSDATFVSAGLAWGMESFAIAHELAHSAAGHTLGESLSAGDPEASTNGIWHAQEFEADGLAFELIIAASWRTSLASSSWIPSPPSTPCRPSAGPLPAPATGFAGKGASPGFPGGNDDGQGDRRRSIPVVGAKNINDLNALQKNAASQVLGPQTVPY